MESTDVKIEPATQKSGDVSLKEKAEGTSCSGSACMFSNYYALAFLIPFLAVTAYSLAQGATCAATGGQACAFSAFAVGGLAGLTSLGLVTAIKKMRKLAVKRT